MTEEQFFALTGYQFKRQELLQQALTHRSFARSANNERLEFLGDSVLNLIITRHIYHRFGDADEGELSRIRASLVKQSTLAKVARGINLGESINLGGGELKSGGYRRASILADTLEAVVGAVFLDSDFLQAEKVVLLLYREQLEKIDSGTDYKDPKTRLQEYLQSRQQELPVYAVEQMTGQAHAQKFTVSCKLVELEMQETGSGSSRKRAEQQAASKLLDRLEQ
ncbi:MAG TPA: ribonuclease III [Gammaproteobacteria bacterium]|nr:ribonuclease III [Gammaproteobacteria bacterium]